MELMSQHHLMYWIMSVHLKASFRSTPSPTLFLPMVRNPNLNKVKNTVSFHSTKKPGCTRYTNLRWHSGGIVFQCSDSETMFLTRIDG